MSGAFTAPPNPVREGECVIDTVRLWSEAEFSASQQAWDRLLAASAANPLFMSWAWQHAWWREFGVTLGSRLQVYAGYSPAGELVALAPLHLRSVNLRGPLRIRRLESLGSTWRDPASAFSEYFDFIIEPAFADAFCAALAPRLFDEARCSDVVIANTPPDSHARRFMREYVSGVRYLRELDVLHAHRTELPAQFSEYLAHLSGSTRRKLWNHRRRLQEPRLVLYPQTQIGEFLDELDQFHESRWGQRHFLGQRRSFHLAFAASMAQAGALRMSRIEAASGTMSLMYNVRLRDTEYNIQSGFGVRCPSGTSPGYLHFGFLLEQACRDGLRHFDFLAGQGRSRDYKKDFITQRTELLTLHALCTQPLGWLYRNYDRLRAPAAVTVVPG